MLVSFVPNIDRIPQEPEMLQSEHDFQGQGQMTLKI